MLSNIFIFVVILLCIAFTFFMFILSKGMVAFIGTIFLLWFTAHFIKSGLKELRK